MAGEGGFVMRRWLLMIVVFCGCPQQPAKGPGAGPTEECSRLLAAWRDTSFGGVDPSEDVMRRLRALASGRAFELCADVDLAAVLALSMSRLEDRRVVVNANGYDRPAREVRHWALAIIEALTGKTFGAPARSEEERVQAVRDWWTQEGSRNPAGVIGAHRALALRSEQERRSSLVRTSDLAVGQSWTIRKTAEGPFTTEERQAMAAAGLYAWRGAALVLLEVTAAGAVETSVSTPKLMMDSHALAVAVWPFSNVLPLSALNEGRPTPGEVVRRR
jgi:hypothetical protein